MVDIVPFTVSTCELFLVGGEDHEFEGCVIGKT